MKQMKNVLKKGAAGLALMSVMLIGFGSSSLALQCPEVGRTGRHYTPNPATITTTYIPVFPMGNGQFLYITYNHFYWTCSYCGDDYNHQVSVGHTVM